MGYSANLKGLARKSLGERAPASNVCASNTRACICRCVRASVCPRSPALISPWSPPTKTVLVGSRRGDGHLIELLSERAHGITCTYNKQGGVGGIGTMGNTRTYRQTRTRRHTTPFSSCHFTPFTNTVRTKHICSVNNFQFGEGREALKRSY